MTVGDWIDRIVKDAVEEALEEEMEKRNAEISQKDAEIIQKDAEIERMRELLKKHNINADDELS